MRNWQEKCYSLCLLTSIGTIQGLRAGIMQQRDEAIQANFDWLQQP